jgi:DNA mismatch repair protein MutS2
MSKYIDPFLVNLPILDLHGEYVDSARVLVDEFINDSIKLKKYKIVLIHGKGSSILKDFIHEYLKKDKRVDNYYLDINTGQTIVELKKNE